MIIGTGFGPVAVQADASFKKVLVIVLENTDYDNALAQPFLGNLIKRGALFSRFYAVTHPSQPNYIAMIGGDTLGVLGDTSVNLNQTHLGDLLESKGKTWKAYAEDYPGGCFLGASRGKYVRKHVPFLSFKNVQQSPTRCARVVKGTDFTVDLKANALPDYSMYIPNLDNDGHDTGISFADKWLNGFLSPILSDSALLKDLLVVVTFDESSWASPTNQIFTVLVGGGVVAGAESSQKTTHYDVLRTIEEAFGLGSLGRKDTTALPIRGIWN